ncbi:hypothetical protein B0F90DRAFT_1921236 [Multifurca ochricompacta]|uniref:Uncharacterized protein n=1 Tax=Multifurca ochricompacta TaxID=376703 RepID=A0AAD4LTW6_9AGAM|nr:hypothetical protein B0F90DRAFT_1921236 [Multifurca ochricompacta]
MGIWFVANQEQGQSPYHPIADKMSNIVHDKDKPYQKHNHVGQPHRSHISVGGFPPGSGVNGEITGPTGVRVDVGILPQESEKVRDHMVQSHMVRDHMVKDHMAKGHMARSHMTGRGSSTSQSRRLDWQGQCQRSYGCQPQGQGTDTGQDKGQASGEGGSTANSTVAELSGGVLGTQATGIRQGPKAVSQGHQVKGPRHKAIGIWVLGPKWSRDGGIGEWTVKCGARGRCSIHLSDDHSLDKGFNSHVI